MDGDFAHVILARLDQIQADLASLRTVRIGRSDVMDFQETLRYLKIRPGTLRDWIRLRRIPFHRAGRRILFRARDLDAWLEARKVAHRLSKRELRAAS